VVEYDGTDFSGFQWQVGKRTVQGELESAIERITGERVRVIGAGRTDAGVHAVGQVINFWIGSCMSAEGLERGLNGVLSWDVAVRRVEEVNEKFHARYSARCRTYEYRIWNGKVRSPLHERYWHHVREELDARAMQEVGQVFVGRHDFRGVACGRSENWVREVYAVECKREGEEVVVRITANAFLYKMVRCMVGLMVDVGLGRRNEGEVVKVLETGARYKGFEVLPAKGVWLIKVSY